MLLGVSSAPFVKVDLKFLPPKTRNIHVMHLFFAVIHFIDSLDSIDVKAGSKSFHSLKCRWALSLRQRRAALPVSCAASGPLGRFLHRPQCD